MTRSWRTARYAKTSDTSAVRNYRFFQGRTRKSWNRTGKDYDGEELLESSRLTSVPFFFGFFWFFNFSSSRED